jgi:hypothetical protein
VANATPHSRIREKKEKKKKSIIVCIADAKLSMLHCLAKVTKVARFVELNSPKKDKICSALSYTLLETDVTENAGHIRPVT